MESLTELKIPDKQISELKKAIQQTEYKKVSKEVAKDNRTFWNNNKDKLIKEWEEKTGQKWPRYEADVFQGTQKMGTKGNYVSGHHIIELNHGGPNTWWNIYPIHIADHNKLHTTGTVSHQIFTKVIKK